MTALAQQQITDLEHYLEVIERQPGALAIEVQAQVVWTERENSTGVQFLNLKDEYRKAIAKFMEGV